MNKESAEIDLRIPADGTLVIPKGVVNRLNVKAGEKVHVRVTTSILSGKLKQQNVSEEEIERISAVQMEPRDNVIKFLATESRLSGNRAFSRRAEGLRGKR